MNSPIYEAAKFAEKAHHGQERKYTGEPYIHHPFEVAGMVSNVTTDKDMIIAAILHDVVEDTVVSIKGIEDKFGSRIAGMVGDLTDASVPSDGNRATRKAIDFHHTAGASSEAKTIKLADLIDNSGSILKYDPNFAKVFMREMRNLLHVLEDGDQGLYQIATNIVNNYFKEKEIS